MSSTIRESTIKFLEARDAFWRWKGHKHVAELTSGKLSDFFVNCTPLFTSPETQDLVAEELAYLGGDPIDQENLWVVGSAMGAIGLAQSLARHFIANAAFTEPDVEYTETSSRRTMELKRFDLGEKPYVVLCEDVITTFSTTHRTMLGIQAKHPDVRFHDDILVIVNRSGKRWVGVDGGLNDDGPMRIQALIDVIPKTWDSVTDLPEGMKDCVPIRPKANWQALADEML